MGVKRIATAVAVLAAAVGVVGGSPPAGAVEITVTLTVDSVNGGDGLTSLREAFTEATTTDGDDVVVLGVGQTYTLSDCLNGPVTHGDDHVLTVVGNGSTITTSCDAEGIVESSDHAGTLVLEDLTLVGGPNVGAVAVEGAAVRSESTLRLDGVEIHDVSSPGGSVVWSSFGHGTTPYRVTVIDSSFHDNTGSVVFGDNPSVSITGSSISGNTGSGVSLVDGYPLTIVDSVISSNTVTGVSSTGQGFAENSVSVTGSTIADNGRVGLSCSNCGTLVVTDTTVTGNGLASVTARGGIWFTLSQRAPTAPSVTISTSTISGNHSAEPGGGLRVGPVLLEPGAAVAQISLSDTVLSGNDATGNGGGASIGVGALELTGVTLDANTATTDGGGLWYDDATGPYDVLIHGSTVTGNDAGGDGGGVAVTGAVAFHVEGSTVAGNTAAGDGGGVDVAQSFSTVFLESRLGGNGAVNGAGLDASAEVVQFERSTVDGNVAGGVGGGARIAAIAGYSINSTFDGNVAAVGGALAFTTPSHVEVTQSTLSGNAATSGAHVSSPAAPASVVIARSAVVAPAGGGASCTGTDGAFPGASVGHSFLADPSCGSTATDVVSGDDPQLGALADNGGPTPTRLPAPSSPLGGLVPAASCDPLVDQRGVVRPQGDGCDAGSVEIVESAAAAPITGTEGGDVLVGTPGPDAIFGLGGDDAVFGLAGPDHLEGGAGADLLFGGAGADVLVGGPGRDVLTGGPGADELTGGPGVDILLVDGADTVVDGGPGPDLCWLPGRILPRDC